MGQKEDARAAARKATADGTPADGALESVYVLAVAGERRKAHERLEAYDLPWQPYAMYWRARIHAVLGETDAALEWLGRAVDKGLFRPAAAAKDPRFAKLLARLQRRG